MMMNRIRMSLVVDSDSALKYEPPPGAYLEETTQGGAGAVGCKKPLLCIDY